MAFFQLSCPQHSTALIVAFVPRYSAPRTLVCFSPRSRASADRTKVYITFAVSGNDDVSRFSERHDQGIEIVCIEHNLRSSQIPFERSN
jgi:hypothetical protein